MSKSDAVICVYLPKNLLSAIDAKVAKMSCSRSFYIRSLILDHFSQEDNNLREHLMGNEELKKGENIC